MGLEGVRWALGGGSLGLGGIRWGQGGRVGKGGIWEGGPPPCGASVRHAEEAGSVHLLIMYARRKQEACTC